MDEHQYDYANFEENDRNERVRRNQEGGLQSNNQEMALQIVQNPYYGTENPEIEMSRQIQNIKVIENPYYE